MASDRWTWAVAVHRYRDGDSGQFLSPTTVVALRDDVVARQRAHVVALAQRLAEQDISVQRWEMEMRDRVRLVHTVAYAFGRGGRNAMTPADRRELGELVRDQWDYLHAFAADVAAGDLSAAQIAARAQLYVNAATHAQARGYARSHAGLRLPAHPGDGGSECLANCRCAWEIDETDDEWRCTWRVSAEESCATCSRRATDWAPLIVAKE